MTREKETIWCDGCGVEIQWAPLVRESQDYCCQACLDGFACDCGERRELDERRAAQAAEVPGSLSAGSG